MPISISIGIGLGQTQLNGGGATVPTAPSAFAIEQWSLTRGNGLLTVGIDSLPYNGNSPITRVEYRLNGGAAVSSGGVVGFNITGLTNGTSYGVELRAVNTVGNGAWSDLKSATPATVPAAPTIAATPANGQNTITNTDGATGGSPITTRLLYRSLTSGFTPGVGNLIATNPTYPYIDTGLTNGTVYYYKAVNGNDVGPGAASTQASAQPVGVPTWSVAPSISGTAQVGQTLTGADGTIVNGAATSRQWKRGGVDISGATSTTYLLTSTDLDALITYQVNATGVGGPASATSAAVGPVAAAPAEAPVLTFDGTTFTSNLPGQFQVDGVNVGPSNATTLTYNSGTMLGKWVGITNGILSNVIVIESENPVTLIDFNQANGTKLSAYPTTPFTLRGGTTGEKDGYTCQSNQMQTTAQSSSVRAIATRSTGSTEHYAEYKTTGATPPELITCAVDENTFLATNAQDMGAGRWFVFAYIANGGYNQGTNQAPNGFQVPGSAAVGQVVRTVIQNGKWQFRVNGQPYAKSISYGADAEPGDVWYDLPAGLVSAGGQEVGLLNPYSAAACDDFRYQSLSKPINITSVEIFQDGTDQKVRITGTAAASALNSAVILLTKNDPETLVAGWAAVAGAPGAPGGAFTIESAALPTGLSGDELHVYLSDNTTRSRTTSQIATVPFVSPGFQKGINNSNAGVNHRNLFARMEVLFPEESYQRLRQAGDTLSGDVPASLAGMGYDGVIQSYVPGFAAKYCYSCGGVFIEQGIYEIYYPAGMSCVLTNSSGGALSGVTILTAFSGGYGKIQISVDKPSLLFTFSGGTNGSLNLKPTGYLESDTNRSRLFADSSIVPWVTAGAKVERHLDSLFANGPQSGDQVVRLTAGQIWDGGAGVSGPWSPEMIAEKANAQNTDVWIPCSYLWQGAEFLTAFFTRLIAALDADLKVYVEPPNETWNTVFGADGWARKEGVLAGFYPLELTNSDDAVPLEAEYSASFVDHDPDTGYMLRTWPINTMVLFDNYYYVGTFWARAKKNIVTGASDKIERTGSTPIDNAAWEIVGDNGEAQRAHKRWYAYWADFLWDIADQVCVTAGYNPREKIVRVLAWQTNNYPTDILAFNNIHERFDAWAEAPYWGRDELHWTDTPLTTEEKALLGTDIPAFIAAFNASATISVATKIAEFPARKAAAEAVFASFGYLSGEKRLISYEMNWHITTTPHVTDGSAGHWHPNMSTVYPMIRRQSIMETWTSDYFTGWASVYHDVACAYDSVGELADDYNGRFGYFSYMEDNNDITNPSFAGFASVPNET